MSRIGRYLLIEVGCLECHNPSYVRGTFNSVNEAMAASQDRPIMAKMSRACDWHGESVEVVYDLLEPTPYTVPYQGAQTEA